MKNSILYTFILSLILFPLTACDKKDSAISSTVSSSSAATTSIATDAWLGRWNGPEGTFIEISGGDGKYDITIQDLDGAKRYQGKNNSNHIIFERNGITEIIRASNGVDTGMKWLADKSNCLKIDLGEGWCRD